MKYIVILADGMSDRPLEELGGKTPMMAAKTPVFDYLSGMGECGRARTLYSDLPTGSDTANLSVLGYEPHKYYTGRSPIEALGLGIPLCGEDTVFRLNLVTIEENIMLDHSAGKIETSEANELIKALNEEFCDRLINIHPGVSYRHVLTWKGIDYKYSMTPPHDILGQNILSHLDSGGPEIRAMIERSYELLSKHPVNLSRAANCLPPANCMWLWGNGKKPEYPSFKEQYGLDGAVITAVPLISGLAVGMGMRSVSVEGATGDYNTNYRGKALAALKCLETHDFVFIHVEAPDECGHDGDIKNKIKSIERIDGEIAGVIYEAMGDLPYRMMIMPDHATPISLRTHVCDPVPFLIYDNTCRKQNTIAFNETDTANGIIFEHAYLLMPYFLNKGDCGGERI